MTHALETLHREAKESLLAKIEETVASATTNGIAKFDYDTSDVRFLYKGREYRAEALSVHNGRLMVWMYDHVSGKRFRVRVKDVRFLSFEALVRNVVAATRFPESLRKAAESFYGKDIDIFGHTIRITGYAARENGCRCDLYVFRMDDGNPIALTASQIRLAAKAAEKKNQEE